MDKTDALFGDDSGTSSVEYALCTLAAAAFAGLLYAIIQSPAVLDGLSALIERALRP